MSYLIVATTDSGDRFYTGSFHVSKWYSDDVTEAIKYDERIDAEQMLVKLKNNWANDTLFEKLGINMRFWIEDTNKPRFNGILNELTEM